jgi:hypothetical protein
MATPMLYVFVSPTDGPAYALAQTVLDSVADVVVGSRVNRTASTESSLDLVVELGVLSGPTTILAIRQKATKTWQVLARWNSLPPVADIRRVLRAIGE